VACSGGLDSALLLHLVADYGRLKGIRCHAFHVHHGLSPNADDWLAHCAQQAADLGAAFDAVRVTLSEVAAHGVEQAARIARYRALGELCRRHGVALLLTAHHQDDQAETVLLQLFRGAGMRGLSGMANADDAHALLGGGVLLGRPLLGFGRSELEQAVAVLGIVPVVDESNADVRYRRNAVRHGILPEVDRHFPGAATAIARSSRHWQSAQRLLDELARIDYANCADLAAGESSVALRLDRLSMLSADRADNLLRYWLVEQGAERPPSEAQLEQLRRQASEADADAHPSLELCGLRLQRQNGRLIVSHVPDGLPPLEEIHLRWQGEASISVPEWRGTLLFEPGMGGIPADLLGGTQLSLHARTGGERLQPDARRPSRSLKNLYQEAHLPAPWRPWLPLVYLGDRLVFAAGLGMDIRSPWEKDGVNVRWLPDLP
jgi:tRNA(Ile)-lysidine synthase